MKKNGFKFAIISACLLFSFGFNVHAGSKLPKATHDIRILIDVSGSMKWNDPNNLRIPALKLLANLLPHNAQAGVWTFGRQVNMLVPLANVDNQWKQQATEAAEEIHSRGLFTNIEETLEKSTWDWKKNDKTFERTIILLTDGLVDIDKEPAKNSLSREKILSKIIPRLTQAGATIHTIALSGEADELLLQQLSATSSGWYEKAKDAEDLERIFFRMFEKTTQPDTLPLVDNQVIVDSSIKEMTFLLFNRDKTQPPQITPPEGKAFGLRSASENINWHHESRYDLITISDPARGTWHVNADIDPDNRVMVVTDLKMVTTSFPDNIYLDDPQYYFVSLSSDGEVITKPAFHRFVDITLQQAQSNRQTLYKLRDDGNSPDGKANDGTYSLNLGGILNEGKHELVTYVDGTTFKREKRHLVNVHTSPVITSIKPEMILDAAIETLFVIPRTDMINPDSMTLHATVSNNTGEVQKLEIPRSSHNEWKLPLGDFASDRQHTVSINIEGTRPNGKPVRSNVGPIPFGNNAKQVHDAPPTAGPVEHVEAEEIPEEVPNEIEEPIATPPAVEATKDASSDQAKISWIAVMIPIVMFNLLLGGGAYFGYRKWKNRPISAQQKPWEALAHE